MPEQPKPYNFEQEQDEAAKMQAKDYDEAEKLSEKEKEPETETIEKELSPEVIKKIMEKVRDINKIGTAYKSIDKSILEKILEQGLLGSSPENRPELKNDSRKIWVENVRKKRQGQVFFNIIGISQHENEYGRRSTIKTASFNKGQMTVLFDINKYSSEFPLKNYGGYGYSKDKQKINTFRYSDKGYEKPDKETAKKYYNERQQYLKLHPKDRKSEDDLEFNDENWQLFLPKIDKDFGFNLSFRVAPRLFKGIVIIPERKLNSQEICDRLEESEKRHKEDLRQREENDKLYKMRVKYCTETYESVEDGIINHETTEELDPKKRIEYVKDIALKMIKINKGKLENLLPIYDFDGNLLWPKRMGYEEVKKFVAERDKGKNK